MESLGRGVGVRMESTEADDTPANIIGRIRFPSFRKNWIVITNCNRLRLTRAVLLLVPAYDRTIDPATTGPTRTFPPRFPPPVGLTHPKFQPNHPRSAPIAVRETHPCGFVTRRGAQSASPLPIGSRHFDNRSPSSFLSVSAIIYNFHPGIPADFELIAWASNWRRGFNRFSFDFIRRLLILDIMVIIDWTVITVFEGKF